MSPKSCWPHLRQEFVFEYGPFDNAATLILWVFFASMLILTGARRLRPEP